jgi:hypothetical protein
MIWRFSDGTTVELGGNVEGATLLAQRLRVELAETRTINIWPPPGGDVPLELTDPALLDRFLTEHLDYLTRVRGLKITLDRPKVPSLPRDPRPAREPGRVY